MNTPISWLLKLVLSHLLTDFILQPGGWIRDRQSRHFGSPKLYLHGLITAATALVFIGWDYWPVALAIFITHTIIDGWKSYRKETVTYFLIDQSLHLAVILVCWYFIFQPVSLLRTAWDQINTNAHFWVITVAAIFLTRPAGVLIGQMTRQWREKIEDAESLANAGKWIGIAERLIVLMLMLLNAYSAIGLLVAAKGIIRFSEKDRPEIKTEYLVIGTLLSIGIAILTGLLTKLF